MIKYQYLFLFLLTGCASFLDRDYNNWKSEFQARWEHINVTTCKNQCDDRPEIAYCYSAVAELKAKDPSTESAVVICPRIANECYMKCEHLWGRGIKYPKAY